MWGNKFYLNRVLHLLLACLVLAFSGCREILTNVSNFDNTAKLLSPNTQTEPKLAAIKPSRINPAKQPKTKNKSDTLTPTIIANPKELMDATRSDVLAKLGEVSLERREKQSLVLQFIDDDCILEVFLYGPYNRERASDFQFRSATDQSITATACYNRIRK